MNIYNPSPDASAATRTPHRRLTARRDQSPGDPRSPRSRSGPLNGNYHDTLEIIGLGVVTAAIIIFMVRAGSGVKHLNTRDKY